MPSEKKSVLHMPVGKALVMFFSAVGIAFLLMFLYGRVFLDRQQDEAAKRRQESAELYRGLIERQADYTIENEREKDE